MRQCWHAPRLAVLFMLLWCVPTLCAQPGSEPDLIVIDANAAAHPFPHFWEQMFGSGRAILSLRDSYRQDLRAVKQVTDFGYVRFHAILDDDVGVYDEDSQGQPVYNFSYIDQIYDGLLANGVRPFVEISFMPNKLAANNIHQGFWYSPNVSPPKDWGRWDDLVAALARHLVDRYGVDEVAQWYFEVWNEPNLDFWAGQPRQSTYWELYDHTARAIKAVNPRLRVGGPATAQAAWVDAFIRHCAEGNIPLDFVSTHVYGNDGAQDVFGSQETISRDQMVCRAVDKVHHQIAASTMPKLPLIWSEFNASYKNETDVTDAIYMGPWLADMIRQCDGLVDSMSYWTFSDVFEEQGVVKTPFYGGYGLVAVDGIPKPAFNAFKLLHRLGDERIQLDSDSALLTRKKDGTLALAVWNYAPPEQVGVPRRITLRLKGTNATHALISRVDGDHGDFHSAYAKMGSPRYPTPAQIQELRQAAELPASEPSEIKHGELAITLPAHGLALIEIK
ncbi:MAG: glycosyl hydrolase family 39 [Candidatus Sulfotelmatobacter sp.]|jgi:xylan 1,4-beta-xylosidase